mmetsp:Transcript_9061/g.26412  ORF Transcript_9061/g.26412 Transcript_9061/m.26412 type:complete len:80 (+) Transcript_9061:108-347(+)
MPRDRSGPLPSPLTEFMNTVEDLGGVKTLGALFLFVLSAYLILLALMAKSTRDIRKEIEEKRQRHAAIQKNAAKQKKLE